MTTPSGYDVHPGDLRAGGARLTGDADRVGQSGLTAADGAAAAAAGTAGGALAAALSRFEVALGSTIPGLAGEVRRSASALQATATQYEADDMGAFGDVSPVIPGLTLPPG